jgi:hypothetical protein
MVCMAGVSPECSHSMAHALALDPRTWPRVDVPRLVLIDEDVDLLRGGVYDLLAHGLKGLIRILIPISCNFSSGSPLLTAVKYLIQSHQSLHFNIRTMHPH